MNKEKKFENWQEVIVDFFENRISDSKLFKARKYIADKNIGIEKLQKEKEKDIKKLENLQKAKEKKAKELPQLRKDAPRTEIRNWLCKITDENAKKAPIKESHEVFQATHVLKFTHTSAKAGSLLLKEKSDDVLLSTASLKKDTKLDLAHNDGALISISRFLSLTLNDISIFDLILKDDFDFLNSFFTNSIELNNCKKVFLNLLNKPTIKTADKAKQLYFPLSKDFKTYHLVTPLFASSLYNEIHIIINNLKYKEQKEINKYRNHKKDNNNLPKYYQSTYTNYPNLAVQNFGGEYPRNISMLNADRLGKVYLFSTQPPMWHSKLKPPINKQSMFDSYYLSQDSKITLQHLSKFLSRFSNLNLSIKDPKRKKHLIRWVNDIIDDWLFYIINIQNLTPNWSKESKLKIEHQYLLDPYREDEEFQIQLKDTNSQEVVCDDFAKWLNKQLHNKDKTFTPQPLHSRIWKSLVRPVLREHFETIKIDIKNANKEQK